MRIDLDAKLPTSDGSDTGTIQRAVFDPGSDDVETGFRISGAQGRAGT